MTAITTSGTWTGLEVVSAGSGEQKQAATANVRPRITVGTRSIRSSLKGCPFPQRQPISDQPMPAYRTDLWSRPCPQISARGFSGRNGNPLILISEHMKV